MTTFWLGELFCGPGGLARGALGAAISDPGFRVVHRWATDYDPDACRTYAANICPGRPGTVICEDVRRLDLGALGAVGPIDALAFGFPCNDFSLVGERRGLDGSFGPLYSYGVEALRRFSPRWFLAENVGGLRNSNQGAAFATILREMRSAGYALTPHLYRFEDYGVPQTRHRIIIVGIRDGEGVRFRVPAPRPGPRTSCREAVGNPPIPPDAPNHKPTRQSKTVVRRLQHIRPGQNAFTADLPEDLRLNVAGATISQIYRRLDPDKPSYTVTGSGGGGTHVYHWSEPRALTNRERARLQTFPDDFVFQGSKEAVRRQIGMAVPCLAATVIVRAVLNTFASIPYASVEANLEAPR